MERLSSVNCYDGKTGSINMWVARLIAKSFHGWKHWHGSFACPKGSRQKSLRQHVPKGKLICSLGRQC